MIELHCTYRAVFFVDGRKLCTGSRDNWMCLWDIESAKCEQRHNISRNLVRITVCGFLLCTQPCTKNCFKHVECPLVCTWPCKKKNQMNKPFNLNFLSSCPAGFTFLYFPFFSVQVTHVCWVPGSSSVVQTSEDKTIRYRKICYRNCITVA